jgi:metal-responsive CopG/Arc/MetJ family transcriptional regulator
MSVALHNHQVAKPPGRPHAHGGPTTQVAFRIPDDLLARIDREIEATGLPVPRSIMVVKLLQEALAGREGATKTARKK